MLMNYLIECHRRCLVVVAIVQKSRVMSTFLKLNVYRYQPSDLKGLQGQLVARCWPNDANLLAATQRKRYCFRGLEALELMG